MKGSPNTPQTFFNQVLAPMIVRMMMERKKGRVKKKGRVVKNGRVMMVKKGRVIKNGRTLMVKNSRVLMVKKGWEIKKGVMRAWKPPRRRRNSEKAGISWLIQVGGCSWGLCLFFFPTLALRHFFKLCCFNTQKALLGLLKEVSIYEVSIILSTKSSWGLSGVWETFFEE